MIEEVFVKRLKEEVMLHVEKEKMVNYEREKNKRRHALMNSDHWKASTSKISNCKRSQRSSDFLAYYWGAAYAMAKKDRESNHLSDQDMTQFLKDRGALRCRFPWCKDVCVDRRFWESLVCLDPTKKGWIMDEDIEWWVNYMWHVRPVEVDWAMVGAYFVHILLQDSILVFIPINETDSHWCLGQLDLWSGVVTFYDSGITYDHEWHEWYLSLTNVVDCTTVAAVDVLMKNETMLDDVQAVDNVVSNHGNAVDNVVSNLL
nr:phospholipase-like protein [Tanacetum cinerariifolium]